MKNPSRFFAVAVALVSMQALAQGYPNKPVHAIISFTPGSSTDIVGRVVMQKVSEYWGQPVVAEHGPRVESLLSDDIAYWKAAARDAKLKVE